MKVSAECFVDNALRSYIEINGEHGKCEASGDETTVIDTLDVSDSFDSFFSSLKEDENGSPLFEFIQQEWGLFNPIYGTVILEVLLEERKLGWDKETLVSYSDAILDEVKKWNSIKRELIEEFRFMTGIKYDLDIYKYIFSTHIRKIEEGSQFYRSRLNEKGTDTPFAKELMGAPPKESAYAGRANPEGIPFLYLCSDPRTTFYEIRVVYLDRVSTGVFSNKRDIRIVDFTKAKSPFDLFGDFEVRENIVAELVMKQLMSDLSKPMRRVDSKLEYIPTQFICEFIKYSTDADGIAFNSSLSSGINYVMFNPEVFECKSVHSYLIDEVLVKASPK